MADLTAGELKAAADYLAEYAGLNKFMRELQSKSKRIDGFQLSQRQAAVVLTIADEETARGNNDSEPF